MTTSLGFQSPVGDLMPAHPRSKALPHLWRWDTLRTLAAKAGELVPVGRGGERRAIALANPGLNGQPFSARSEAGSTDSDARSLDLFRFSDAPVFEALKLNRTSREGE